MDFLDYMNLLSLTFLFPLLHFKFLILMQHMVDSKPGHKNDFSLHM